MNCNCKNKEHPYITHPVGNVLILGIPLLVKTVISEDGVVTKSSTPYQSSGHSSAKVLFSNGYDTVCRDGEVNGNVVRVEDRGKLGIGKYSITILCRDDACRPLCIKKRTVLEISDAVTEGVYDTDEMNVIAYYPVIGGMHYGGIVITEDSVKMYEGTGFDGEITEDAVKLYARPGNSSMSVDEDSVNITIN